MWALGWYGVVDCLWVGFVEIEFLFVVGMFDGIVYDFGEWFLVV